MEWLWEIIKCLISGAGAVITDRCYKKWEQRKLSGARTEKEDDNSIEAQGNKKSVTGRINSNYRTALIIVCSFLIIFAVIQVIEKEISKEEQSAIETEPLILNEDDPEPRGVKEDEIESIESIVTDSILIEKSPEQLEKEMSESQNTFFTPNIDQEELKNVFTLYNLIVNTTNAKDLNQNAFETVKAEILNIIDSKKKGLSDEDFNRHPLVGKILEAKKISDNNKIDNDTETIKKCIELRIEFYDGEPYFTLPNLIANGFVKLQKIYFGFDKEASFKNGTTAINWFKKGLLFKANNKKAPEYLYNIATSYFILADISDLNRELMFDGYLLAASYFRLSNEYNGTGLAEYYAGMAYHKIAIIYEKQDPKTSEWLLLADKHYSNALNYELKKITRRDTNKYLFQINQKLSKFVKRNGQVDDLKSKKEYDAISNEYYDIYKSLQ